MSNNFDKETNLDVLEGLASIAMIGAGLLKFIELCKTTEFAEEVAKAEVSQFRYGDEFRVETEIKESKMLSEIRRIVKE